jgi:hypothetical protein
MIIFGQSSSSTSVFIKSFLRAIGLPKFFPLFFRHLFFKLVDHAFFKWIFLFFIGGRIPNYRIDVLMNWLFFFLFRFVDVTTFFLFRHFSIKLTTFVSPSHHYRPYLMVGIECSVYFVIYDLLLWFDLCWLLRFCFYFLYVILYI